MKKDIVRTKHVIDAAGQAAGRVAAQAAMILMGKHRADYEPHIDMGEYVTIKNAGQMVFSGKKLVQKDYFHHTMYPGGLKRTPMKKVFDENPTDIIVRAVNGMLPKNKLRNERMKRLTVKP